MKTKYGLIVTSVTVFANVSVLALQTPKPAARTVMPFHKDPPSPLQVAGIYGVAPAVPAIVLPMLTETFRASQDPVDLLTVLVAKRGFIYVLATLATLYAGWRASTSLPAGESLDALNREILKGEAPPSESESERDSESESENRERKEVQPAVTVPEKDKDEPIFALLDEVEGDGVGKGLAFALPFFLAVALSISYFLSQGSLFNMPDTGAGTNPGDIDILAIFNSISTLSNLAVCLLFSATEYRSSSVFLPKGNEEEEEEPTFPQKLITIPNMAALAAVLGASFLPLTQAWPLQNSVNIALAVTVTRAIAPFLIGESGSIRIIALALTGLATYDAFSVFGTSLLSVQAAGAIDVAAISDSVTNVISSTPSVPVPGDYIPELPTIITAGDASVMETVALSKLQGPWKPGLLEMVLVGRVSDVIGLADICFPACLVSWSFAKNTAYIGATIGGYVLGSLLTEIASTFGPFQGLPALIFIAPAMLGSVSLLALVKGEMDEVWGEELIFTEDDK